MVSLKLTVSYNVVEIITPIAILISVKIYKFLVDITLPSGKCYN